MSSTWSEGMELWMTNPILHTLAFYSVAVVALVVFLALFELVTKYKVWDEIKRGNLSVAMATGGKIFGIANIFRFSILNNDNVLETLLWSSFGFGLLLVAYYIFEFLTPFFKIDEEIQRDNRAVGFLSMAISIALSYVIGACVT